MAKLLAASSVMSRLVILGLKLSGSSQIRRSSASLSVAGAWINHSGRGGAAVGERLPTARLGPSGSLQSAAAGGSITLSLVNEDFQTRLERGAVIDASGGAALDINKRINGGRGGNITLANGNANQASSDWMQAELLGHGLANLERHVRNLRDVFGVPCVVSINHFAADTEAEHALLRERIGALGVPVLTARHWAEGGRGATDVARELVRLCEQPSTLRFAYEDSDPLWEKMRLLATRIYGAADISASADVRAQIARLQEAGYGHYPVCVAKTQYSFSTDPTQRGAPTGHTVNVREVRLAAGAEFVVMICGDIMTMPGLPKLPSAEFIDVDDEGRVVGLF